MIAGKVSDLLLFTRLIFFSGLVCHKFNWWLFQFHHPKSTDWSRSYIYREGSLKIKRDLKVVKRLLLSAEEPDGLDREQAWGVSGIPLNQLCLWLFLWDFPSSYHYGQQGADQKTPSLSHPVSGASSLSCTVRAGSGHWLEFFAGLRSREHRPGIASVWHVLIYLSALTVIKITDKKYSLWINLHAIQWKADLVLPSMW